MTTVLITGCAGEIGHSLIEQLGASTRIVGVDVQSPDFHAPAGANVQYLQKDITDAKAVAALDAEYNFDKIFHLAAILSTGGEKNPVRAHEVNVQGSLNLLNLARAQSEKQGKPVKFIFPSTIAVYGILNQATKNAAGKVSEDSFLSPITMYGANKLYVENLGRYYQDYYRFLDPEAAKGRIDFRSVRLPGIISALTEPTGGTSDYGPEMLHAAAKGVAYNCFVAPEARLPFMTMPDALRAITMIADAPKEKLSRCVYNVTAFSLTAEEIRTEVLRHFPKATLGYALNEKRNAIVASWPGDTDDSLARKDWGWTPEFDQQRAYNEYLVPAIRKKYEGLAASMLKCGNG